MVLDLPGGLFGQEDVRETNVATTPSGTSYWSCKGAAFQPTNQVYQFNMIAPNFNYLESDVDNQNFVASVNLPEGAVVTEVVVYGNTTADTWTLYRGDVDAVNSEVMATAAVNTVDNTISNATVDNANHGYWLAVADADNGARIYGAKITYTT